MTRQQSLIGRFKTCWHVACDSTHSVNLEKKIQIFLKFVFIPILVCFVSGCTEKNIESKASSQKTLFIGTYQKPEPFIYPMITGGITHPLIDIIFNRLFLLTTDGRLLPELADRWEILEHGKKFVVHLRRGVKFHDGVWLTSRDVVFTLNWLRNPEISNRAGNYSEIETISTADDSTIEITLKKSNVNFLWAAMSLAQIYPSHLFSSLPTQNEIEKFGKHPVGTGPYQFSDWKSDNTITLSANHDYFQGSPHIESIIVRQYSSKLHLFNAFVRGDVDFLEQLNATDYELIRKDATFQAIQDKSHGSYALMFNFNSPVARNINFRKAVSMGLRRNEMIELLEKGSGEPAKQAEAYEPEKAMNLLNRKSLSMRLVVEGSSAKQMTLAKSIRNQLIEIGINVEILPIKGLDATVGHLKGSSDWDAFLFVFQTHEGTYHFEHYLRSKAIANVGDYQNNEISELFDELDTEENINERRILVGKIENILNRERPVCFLYIPYDFTLVSERVKGFDSSFLSHANVSPFFNFKDFEKTNERR